MDLAELFSEIFSSDVTSVDDYGERIDAIKRHTKNMSSSNLKSYYRGDLYCTPIQSKFFREGRIEDEARNFFNYTKVHEEELNKFLEGDLYDSYGDTFKDIMRLSYMQHYESNTRLLDFSKDPYVALRFACGAKTSCMCPKKVTIYCTSSIGCTTDEDQRVLRNFMGLVKSDTNSVSHLDPDILKKDYFIELPLSFPRIDHQKDIFLLMGNFTTTELCSGKINEHQTKVKHELSPTTGRGESYEGFVGVLRIAAQSVDEIREELESTEKYNMKYLMEE